jgi:hypothetical protein
MRVGPLRRGDRDRKRPHDLHERLLLGFSSRIRSVVVLGVGGSSPFAHHIESAGQETWIYPEPGLPCARCLILGVDWEQSTPR